MSNRFIVSAIT